MNVKFYNYVGEPNVLNKIKGIEHVADLNVTKYGDLDPYGMYFELGTLYKTNYCEYSFNGVTYFASVEVSSSADGIFLYNCTVDSATTAWYADCMNVDARIEYSNLGKAKVVDSRIDAEEMIDYHKRVFTDSPLQDIHYCVNIATGETTQSSRATSTIKTYVMNEKVFDRFLYVMFGQCEDEDAPPSDYPPLQANSRILYLPSVLSLYVVRGLKKTDFKRFPTRENIELCASLGEYSSTSGYTATYPLPLARGPQDPHFGPDEYCYEITPGVIDQSPFDWSFDYVPKQIDLNNSLQFFAGAHAHWKISLTQLGINEIKLLGFRRIYNLISEEIIYIPRINQAEYKELAVRVKISEDFPVLTNQAMTDYAGRTSSAWRLGTSAFTAIVPPIIGAVAGGAQSAEEAWAKESARKDVKEAYKGIKTKAGRVEAKHDARQMWKENTLAPSIKDRFRGLGKGIGSSGGIGAFALLGHAVSEMASWKAHQIQSELSGSSVISDTGTDYTSVIEMPVMVIWLTNRELTDSTKFQSKYGKPDGEIRRFNTLKGFVVAKTIYLTMNGLTPPIIAAATEACMKGVYIK